MFNSFTIPKSDSGGSNIKSIQSGVVAGFTTATTLDITIASVVLANSIVSLSISHNYTISQGSFTAVLLNPTTIRLTRYGTQSMTSTAFQLNWVVTEYNNVKSKQTGAYSCTQNGSEQVVAISAINPLKALLVVAFQVTCVDSNLWNSILASRIVSATSFSTYGNGIANNTPNSIVWQLLEFN